MEHENEGGIGVFFWVRTVTSRGYGSHHKNWRVAHALDNTNCFGLYYISSSIDCPRRVVFLLAVSTSIVALTFNVIVLFLRAHLSLPCARHHPNEAHYS